MNVTYHSKHGAVQESMHVFVEAGLRPLLAKHAVLRVLEMGFGTGLNAWLTLKEAEAHGSVICYEAIEAFPLQPEEWVGLNYAAAEEQKIFHQLHACDWDVLQSIRPSFSLLKHHGKLQDFNTGNKFHLVYYDAFAPTAQPELWTVEVFAKLFVLLEPGGVLTTYCSKGNVRRAMQAAGFSIEKIPGPPGKREMVRAHKLVLG